MTTTDEDLHDVKPGRQKASLLLAALATVPGVYLRLSHTHVSDPADAVLYGLAIVGAAFVLAWAAEVAQLDISAGAAIAVLAFIAVLPEYAVDLVFAWKGGNAVAEHGAQCMAPGATGESACSLALANMTGANRLLIGIGWSMVIFVAWTRWRAKGERERVIHLDRSRSVELSYLAVACL